MKKIIRLIVLLLVLALAISFLGSLGNFGGAWFGGSSQKHNSNSGTIPPVDEEDPVDPVDPVNFTVTLSEDGIASANTESAGWALYCTDSTEAVFATHRGSPVNFSSHMEPGKYYYVEVFLVAELNKEGEFVSNTICYRGDHEAVDFEVTLNENGIATADTKRATWFLYDGYKDTVITKFVDVSSPVDFSEFMTVGYLYYVKVIYVEELNDEGTFVSNRVLFSGSANSNLVLCPECNQTYDASLYASCPNPDCPLNATIPEPEPDPMTVCPECNQEYNTQIYSACPNPDCPLNQIPDMRCIVCGIGYLSEGNGICNNPYCPTNNPGINPMVTCPACGQEYNSETYDTCPNADCPLNQSTEIKCTVCNIGYLSEANGVCNNPDCPTNNPVEKEKCPFCDTELVDGECPNEDCPSKYDPTIPCTVCNNGSLSEANGVCNNPDCPTNNPVEKEKCPSCNTELVDGECPNEDCPSKYDPTIPCTVCNNGSLSEANGVCNNPDCPTNNPVEKEKCPFCDTELVDGECPNEDCPSKYDPTIPCTVCNNGSLSEANGVCSNPDCPTNNEGTPELPEGVYLFKNQFLTAVPNGSLPIPTSGVSYTCFVDGVEIATSVAGENGDVGFVNWDDGSGTSSAWVLYYTDLGGWYFHPIDSPVTSGYVSIRVNGGGSDELICTTCNNGYLSEANGVCSNPDCSMNFPDYMVICPGCDQSYDSRDWDSCPNPDCSEYVEVQHCPDCGTGIVSEGGVCNNDYCPSIFSVGLTEQGLAYANTSDGCWYLYDAAGNILVHEELAIGSPVDFSAYMESGKSYYVILDGMAEREGRFRSETIVYEGEGSENEYQRCPDCEEGYLGEAGTCSNPNCPTNNW